MDRLLAQLSELGSPFGDLNVNLLQMQETWIEVLEWLLKSYDMDLFNSIYKNTGDEQSKYKDLTSILNIIGLASANDITVAQGQISAQQKLQILNALADLVLLDRDITFQSSVDEQMTRDVQLLSHVARDQKRLFEDEPNLFPAHMQPLIANATKTKPIAVPSIGELKQTIQELDQNRQQLLTQLEQIDEQIPQGTTLPNVREMRSMQQEMSLQAEQLVAAMKQFSEVYDTQIYSWTNQPQPQLNGVGPAAEKVHSVYQNITRLLQGFDDMKASYAKLTQNNKMEALFASVDLDQNEIYALKENIAILDQAVESKSRNQLRAKNIQIFIGLAQRTTTMDVNLGYHVTKFFSEFRSTTTTVVREAEDLKNRVDRIEIGVNKSNSGVNLYSYFDNLENTINELDDKVRETNEAMALVDLSSQFNFLTQMKEFQLQTERYIDKLDEHLQAQGHKPKTLRNEQKPSEIYSEKKVPPSATKSTLAAKLGYMTPTKFSSDPDDPPTPTLEDFGISESTLASLTDDNKSARKSELSSVQRGLSFTETAVTGVKSSAAPSVTSKPTENVKPSTSSNVSTSVKSVTAAPVTANTAPSVKPSVTPSVSTSTTATNPVEAVSTAPSDHVPADFMNNANIEVREKKKKSGKKKSNNSNPDTIFPLMEMIEAEEMSNLRAILKSKISFDELNKLIEQINEFVTDKRFAGQEDAGYITKEELQSVFNTGDKTQIILLSLIDLKRLKSTSINGNTVFLILTTKTI